MFAYCHDDKNPSFRSPFSQVEYSNVSRTENYDAKNIIRNIRNIGLGQQSKGQISPDQR